LSVAAIPIDILDLARSRRPADRERLLLSVVDLCDAPGAGAVARAPAIQELLSSIFMSLVCEAERDIRKRLAEKLADAPWAPRALINVLALDDIEIAQPIIAASPVLEDEDLIRLVVGATVEHQVEVARRPALSPAVVDAILSKAAPPALTALADNHATDLSAGAMAGLVEAAHRMAGLRAPLSRHPQLTGELARRLYVWVGQSLRQALAARFGLDPDSLAQPLSEAVDEAFAAAARQEAPQEPWSQDGEREAMENRLVAKLVAADQLRPGYLLRALRENQLSLFAAALTALGSYEAGDVRRALDADRPDTLALACAGVRIDRSAFPTILELVRTLNAGRPGGGDDGARRAAGAFGPFPAEIARAAFRQAVRSV